MNGKGLTAQQGSPGVQRVNGNAAFLNRLAAAFLAVQQHQGGGNPAPFRLNGVNSLQRGASCRDDVIHHNHGIPGLEIAFNAAAASNPLISFQSVSPHGWAATVTATRM